MIMSHKLRAAVVGVGYLGTFHVQKYAAHSKVELVGVYDFNSEQALKVSHQFQVKKFETLEEMIGNVDLVTVAATTSAHYELVKFFLKNKIHVNVEKPIASTVKEAEELVMLAQSQKLKLAVGHIERFNPTILALRQMITFSDHIKSIELTRMGSFRARGSDVSVLFDLMIHDVDLMYWLAGIGHQSSPLKSVEVESFLGSGSCIVTPQIDTASVSCHLNNGIFANINVSRVHPSVHRGIRVVTDKFVFQANTGAMTLEKVSLNPSPQDRDDLILTSMQNIEKKDALQAETDAFINCVINDTKPVVSGEDGLRALLLVDLIEKKMS